MRSGPRFTGLDDWLAWQQTLHPDAIDLGLDRARRVLVRTAWRRPSCPVITVGGTNGKGSCVAMLAAILGASGRRVGTFTSPHLVDYRERIRVDGVPVSAASLVVAFERIADALGTDTLTFFEFNTLAALLVFETAAPDVVVLEVGMGGRLDTVNLVDADASVIVSVGFDHMEWLGRDLESIGREKAGIFRRERPAIVGMPSPPHSVLEVAEALGSRLLLRSRDFDGAEQPDGRWRYRDATGELDALPAPALAGAAQLGNAAIALAALRSLGGSLPVGRDAVEQGLRRVRLAGRFQRIADLRGFEWVLDVAHNPDAARTLADNLVRYPAEGSTVAICGMLGDKDIEQVDGVLGGRAERWIAADTEGARGLAGRELAARAAPAGIAMEHGGSVAQAMALAAADAAAGDRIVVFGSFHTVGPALEYLRLSRADGGNPPVWL